jgi:hypothetical protein
MTSGKYIQPYKKIKLENEELKRKLKEIKELVFLVLLSNQGNNKENERDTFLKICAIVTDNDK